PQQAAIDYEVDSGLLDANKVHEGHVVLVANAGQKLAHRVVVDVRRPEEPFTRRLLRPFFAGALLALVYRLLLAVPAGPVARVVALTLFHRELLAKVQSDPAHPLPGFGVFAFWAESPLARPELATLFVRYFVISTWWVGAVLGAVLLWRRGGRGGGGARGVGGGGGGGGGGRGPVGVPEPRPRVSPPPLL